MTDSIYFLSLGCSKNRVDTEVMLGTSRVQGYDLADDPADADVIVVNTCGFIESAKQESIDAVLELAQHKEGRCKKLVMAGCLSQRYADELSEAMPEVDYFLGSSDMLQLAGILRVKSEQESPERLLVGNPADYVMRATDPRSLSVRPHSVYMKLAEGCNRTCSFCAIPAIRGKQRSRSMEDLLREAHDLAELGAVELNLISQDTVSFGRDHGLRGALAELLQGLGEVPGIEWLRVHYLYPEALTDDLIDLFASHPKVLPYIDMPLQHISDRMLRAMRRGHGGERIYRLVERLQKRIPDMSFRTTMIVGHPGETEEDFQELCDFVAAGHFDHLGVFAYSDEEGTRSETQDAKVPPELAQERQQHLMEVQRKISRKRLAAMRGEIVEVLVDGESDESELLLEGRLWSQAQDVDGKVILTNAEAQAGDFLRVKVIESADYDLVGDGEIPAQEAASGENFPASASPRLRRKRTHLPVV